MCFFSVLHVLASLHLFFHLPTLFSLPRVTRQLPACISALVIMEIICGSELCSPTRDISRRMKAAVSSRAGPCPRAPGARLRPRLRPPHQHAGQTIPLERSQVLQIFGGVWNGGLLAFVSTVGCSGRMCAACVRRAESERERAFWVVDDDR